jgi:hypothetical protein
MTTIVLNTAKAVVTEYDWTFTGLTPSRAAGPGGLFTLGGNQDNGVPIAARVMGGRTLLGSVLRKAMGVVYIALRSSGSGQLLVAGRAEWANSFIVNPDGVSRARAGRGIDEDYLALGYANVDGVDFALDAFDAQMPTAKNRRTS